MYTSKSPNKITYSKNYMHFPGKGVFWAHYPLPNYVKKWLKFHELTLFSVGRKNLRKIFPAISCWLFQNKSRNMWPKNWGEKDTRHLRIHVWSLILPLPELLPPTSMTYFGIPGDENTSARWILRTMRLYLWLQNWILNDKIPYRISCSTWANKIP